jgi:hypothetical protein
MKNLGHCKKWLKIIQVKKKSNNNLTFQNVNKEADKQKIADTPSIILFQISTDRQMDKEEVKYFSGSNKLLFNLFKDILTLEINMSSFSKNTHQ